jgi:hypothetical protein
MITVHLALKESSGTYQPGARIETPDRPEVK